MRGLREPKLFLFLVSLARVTSYDEITLKVKAGPFSISLDYYGREEDTISDAEARRFDIRPEKECIKRFTTVSDLPIPPAYCYLKEPSDGSHYPSELKNYRVKSVYHIEEIRVLENQTRRVFLSEVRHKNSASISTFTLEVNDTSFEILDKIWHKSPVSSGPNEKLTRPDPDPDEYSVVSKAAFDRKLSLRYEALGLGDEWTYLHKLGTQEEKTRRRNIDTGIRFKMKLAPRTCIDFRTFAFVRIVELEILYANYLVGTAVGVWIRSGFFWDEYHYYTLDVHFLQNKKFVYSEKIRMQLYTAGQIVANPVENATCNGEAPGPDLMPLVLHQTET